MSEFSRLLDSTRDDLALAVLRSADDDQPLPGSAVAVAAALGLSGATTVGLSVAASAVKLSSGAAGAASAGALPGASTLTSGTATMGTAVSGSAVSSSVTLFGLAKQVLIGIVTGACAMGGVDYAMQRSQPSAAEPAVASRAPLNSVVSRRPIRRASVSVSAREPAPVTDPAEPPPVAVKAGAPRGAAPRKPAPVSAPAAEPQLGSAPTPVMASTPSQSPLSAGSAGAAASSEAAVASAQIEQNRWLAREVALLDRARTALLAGKPELTLAVLAEYRAQRRTGTLDPEATVLRIHALENRGEHANAVRLARDFLSTHPESRHADSIRALAAGASP